MALSWLMMVFLLLPNKLHSQSDTTAFDFTEFDRRDPNLIFQGDALVLNTKTIRLTNFGGQNRIGRVLYSPPIRLWDRAGRRQANFQTVFRGVIGNFPFHRLGDGMSFFIAPVNTTFPTASASARGHMGLYDSSSGASPVPLFAVELDVFIDSWDPNYRHLGINLNSRDSVAVERWDSDGNGRFMEARITYDARQRLISVFANGTRDPYIPDDDPLIARLEHTFDLKTLLPEWVQIGISASTGQNASAIHDIDTWSFLSFMVSDDVNKQDEDNYIPQYV